ncbi:hypothetical protein LYNGBM3L_52240 [Moorena producens 3L]|uniref:Uncharacterized protein n=1 Tax=Moorena producens 3L TaxID=489825 RepID=F4XQL1_9CYAN|nr:hypothetical protein LYNGBM3L_52240 [Moorena producens 3L]
MKLGRLKTIYLLKQSIYKVKIQEIGDRHQPILRFMKKNAFPMKLGKY